MELTGEICKSILENLPVGVYLVDPQRRIMSWNAGAERVTGYLRQEVIGRRCGGDLLMHCDESKSVLCDGACPLEEALRDGHERQVDVYMLHKDGHRIPVRVHVFPLRDEDGVVLGCAECFDARVVLPAAAIPKLPPGRDESTDLPNRPVIFAWLSAALAEFAAAGLPCGVLAIAIDDIERLLHKDGIKAIEAVLYATGQTLTANVGPADLVGRWSAGIFLVALSACTPAALVQAAHMLHRMTDSESVPWWGDRLSVSISIGGTTARPGDTPESLIERAIQALSEAAEERDQILVI